MFKLFSLRSFIVYANFLFLPVALCCLWLLLPVKSYVAFSGTSMVYYVVMFFTWISFYDLNLPGCSKLMITAFFLVFIGISIGWLKVVTKIDVQTNRLSYSFIDGITFLLCTICYFIYIAYYKLKKNFIDDKEEIYDSEGHRRTKRKSKSWTKRISRIMCYYRLIDMDEEDALKQIDRERSLRDSSNGGPRSIDVSGENFKTNGRNDNEAQDDMNVGAIEMNTFQDLSNSQEKPSNPAHSFLSSSAFKETLKTDKQGNLQDSSFKTRTKTITAENYTLRPKYEISYRNYLSVVFYQLFVIGTWFWLHNFELFIREYNYFRTPFLALFSIVVFQASRIVLMGISNGLNRLLKPTEIKYFTLFQFPLMFFLYYRNLFLNTNNWGITVLISFVIFLIDVVYYPLHMTKKFWLFRHNTLVSYLDKKATTSKIFRIARKMLADENPSYDKHIMNLSVEYYYDKMAEYISLVTMIAFLSLIRGLKWKRENYTAFNQLTDANYHQLLYRYLYLLGFEFAYDLAIRFVSRKYLKIDISNRGRNETISNYCTRFIFSLFVLYDLMDVYNIQLKYLGD
ncbi:hypothetical protein DICPUDRAFT_51779 [Dictyostelium purpureum]|uniref:Uncharacterized protein n=1 Tax=Dictyostelium purpureum TaxID=5786 RepID=F1A5F5_DICPU|nr:uncharacterized protein DICPUDRAFT_51779 [Dictyostelium purpureum]EGC28575.1 hypothetical protein DICPUDRAFT_51779 [Dictyostelium purpureum]|eukprot:XP_003294899.1 hypothetical protein DICPUDRAFT_51779 [Dictyostelium purpureum]